MNTNAAQNAAGIGIISIGMIIGLFYFTGLAIPLLMLSTGIITSPPTGKIIVSVPVFMAAALGIAVGFRALRRSLWLLRVRRNVENLPTARTRSAAMGLVELKGVARPLDDADVDKPIIFGSGYADTKHNQVAPFYLEDETGRVLVRPPPDAFIARDDRFSITRRRGRAIRSEDHAR